MNTQSLIVYRNPLEELFWNALLAGAFTPLLLGFLMAAVITVVIAHSKVWRYRKVLGIDAEALTFLTTSAVSTCAFYYWF